MRSLFYTVPVHSRSLEPCGFHVRMMATCARHTVRGCEHAVLNRLRHRAAPHYIIRDKRCRKTICTTPADGGDESRQREAVERRRRRGGVSGRRIIINLGCVACALVCRGPENQTWEGARGQKSIMPCTTHDTTSVLSEQCSLALVFVK